MNLIECIGDPGKAYLVSFLSVLIVLQYLIISQKWSEAQINYKKGRFNNPWFWLRTIFIFCGVCGYGLTATSLFNLSLSYDIKIISSVGLVIVNTVFLLSSANTVFIVQARDAQLGREVKNTLEEFNKGSLNVTDTIAEINLTLKRVLKEYEDK